MRGPDGRWMIGMDEATGRLMRAVASESVLDRAGEDPPSVAQVAAVLHALADHTALGQAVEYLRNPSDGPALSVGRWLHDLGDYVERG